MTKLGEITFTGASGREYVFKSFPLDTIFEEVGGVYAVTSRHTVAAGARLGQTVIYIGHTDNMAQRFGEHQKSECFSQHDANCICLHHDDDENSRSTTEKDLIEALKPPCNE